MGKKLFITDLDGTLFTDNRTISKQDFSSLSMLRAKGIVTAIATGRSLFSFARAMDQIHLGFGDLPVDFLVFSTGAGTLALPHETLLETHCLGPEEILQVCAYFDGMKLDYMVHRSIPHTHHFVYQSHGRENPDFVGRIQLYREFSRPMNSHGPGLDSATEILAVVPGGIGALAMDQIRNDLSGYSVIHATSPLDHASSWIEVFDKQVSKSRACQRLIDHCGIRREHVTAVGNDYNDQDLLEWAGHGFMVANGPGDLRSSFALVDSNNNNGVTRAAMFSGLLETV